MSETNEQRIYDRCIIRVGQLEADNAELRELVADMYMAIGELCDRQDCDACKLRDDGACERGVLTARACALGVEVVSV